MFVVLLDLLVFDCCLFGQVEFGGLELGQLFVGSIELFLELFTILVAVSDDLLSLLDVLLEQLDLFKSCVFVFLE